MQDLLSRTLTTGADGMVGSYIDFGIRTNRAMLDVTDRKQVEEVVAKHKPLAIIHLAALTDLDECERNPQKAFSVNTVGTYNAAVASLKAGATFVYVSTSGIFDGEKDGPYTEDDVPNPQNQYAQSKFFAELALQSMRNLRCVIVRVCNVFGGGPAKDGKFVGKIIRQMREGADVHAVSDQYGSPTYGRDLVNAIKILLRDGRTGIFHMGNRGSCSRYDMALHIKKVLGIPNSVLSARLADFHAIARRGRNESMVSSIDIMRPWQEALTEYLKEEWNGYHASDAL